MKRKILPQKLPNDFIAYKPFDASRISILLTQDVTCKEIYENFMYYRIEKKIEENGSIELDCHFNEEFSSIGVKKVPINILNDSNIIDFIIKSIDCNYYIFLPIETSCISNYINYKKRNNPHHIFIYGYDLVEKLFYCSEFFGFSERPYSSELVNFHELENSYYNLQERLNESIMDDEWAHWMKDIQLLYSYKKFNDRFSIGRIVNGLSYYLDERDYCGNKNYIHNVYYGFAIYDLVIGYSKKHLMISDKPYDIRGVSLIYYHFHYLLIQIKFIIDEFGFMDLENIVPEFDILRNHSRILLSLGIKYRIKLNTNDLYSIITSLDKLKMLDYELTNKYIDKLKYIQNYKSMH